MKSCVSELRTQLMGVGAISVIVSHSHEFLPKVGLIGRAIDYLGLSVYLFAFLTGYGLLNAMRGGVSHYYLRRCRRVFIPYLLIAGAYYAVKYLASGNVAAFFFGISTLSFWFDHQGAWYVAMVIPLYLVYPALDRLFKKVNYILIGAILCIGIILILAKIDKYAPDLYDHLSKVFNSYFVFLLGNIYARRDAHPNFAKKEEVIWGCCLIVACLICKLCGLNSYHFAVSLSRAVSMAGLTIIIAAILKMLKIEWLQRILRFTGQYSLELYLLNIYLIDWARASAFNQGLQNYLVIVSVEVMLVFGWHFIKTGKHRTEPHPRN